MKSNRIRVIRHHSYAEAEAWLQRTIIAQPEFITDATFEVLSTGFILEDITLNKNNRSNYGYAEAFFQWILSGNKELSSDVIKLNPRSKAFVDNTGLPSSFSTSYGWKIMSQLPIVMEELSRFRESRRAYININIPEDKIVFGVDTTHEFPCTIGIQFFVREGFLYCTVNMRSNNAYGVMPYDVYNFTSLQKYIADTLKLQYGEYHHLINNAHIFKPDVLKLKEKFYAKKDN